MLPLAMTPTGVTGELGELVEEQDARRPVVEASNAAARDERLDLVTFVHV
jgi:hypothetical protein